MKDESPEEEQERLKEQSLENQAEASAIDEYEREQKEKKLQMSKLQG